MSKTTKPKTSKPFAKELIKFCRNNIKELNSTPYKKRSTMMGSNHTCVLRPFTLPESIKEKMTINEFQTYQDEAIHYVSVQDIPKAMKWVKEFCD